MEILRQVKEVEQKLGRDLSEPLFDAEGNRIYHNRTIDIDILCYGDFTIKTHDLIIPHPLIAERDFVKKPLLEISKPEIREAFPEIFE
jgi:2-amino-4-hydroxy-6-hydroxymethyldihydropteridine diphosphokinase